LFCVCLTGWWKWGWRSIGISAFFISQILAGCSFRLLPAWLFVRIFALIAISADSFVTLVSGIANSSELCPFLVCSTLPSLLFSWFISFSCNSGWNSDLTCTLGYSGIFISVITAHHVLVPVFFL